MCVCKNSVIVACVLYPPLFPSLNCLFLLNIPRMMSRVLFHSPCVWWSSSGLLVEGVSAKGFISFSPECSSCGLLVKGISAPAITIRDGLSVRLRPLNAVKTLRLNVLLENDNEEELYELEIIENMEVVWGDMEVTLQDSKSHSNVFKVKYILFNLS